MSGDLWLLCPHVKPEVIITSELGFDFFDLGIAFGKPNRSSYTVGESFQGRLKEQCPWRPEYNPQTGYLAKAYLRVAAKT